MKLSDAFDVNEHEEMIIECFLKLWHHSADLMFIMAVESKENDNFSLLDNNPASRKLMGIDSDANIHRLNIRDYLGDEIAEGLYETYDKALEARKPISIEQKVYVNGEHEFYDTLLVPIFDVSGKAKFICGVSRDITKIKNAEKIAVEASEKLKEYNTGLEKINETLDQKVRERTLELERAKEELEKALDAKSAFVARMSHEIRTPINAVIGLSNLAQKTPLNVEQQDYLTKIKDSGDVLLGIVNDVLDFSKIEAGMLTIESVPFHPEELVRTTVNMNSFSAYEKGLELVTDISCDVPKLLDGDPLRIQQILINLVNNAVKFTSEGSICIRLSSEQQDEEIVSLKCEVSDTGIGIPEAQLDRLFSSFTQADDSITRKYGGTGLGLTITQQLCELMGGSISVNSKLGTGTTFTVRLPMKVSANQPKPQSFGQHKPKRILVVDDHEISRTVLKDILNGFSIEADTVSSGLEAIEVIKRSYPDKKYDVIYMDWYMPHMDGIETSQKIREEFQDFAPPILMISAYEKHHIQSYLTNGLINQFIEKPVSRSTVYDSIATFLDINTDEIDDDEEIPDFSGYSILLVEDNPINQQVALGYLDHTNIHVDCAENGAIALEKVRFQSYDLVLMDIQMPVMDGLTASKQLREMPEGQQLPIIAMTAHSSDADKEKSLEAGMNDHLSKPISSEKLYTIIRSHLSEPARQTTKFATEQPQNNDVGASMLELLRNNTSLDVNNALIALRNKEKLYLDIVQSFYRQYLPYLQETTSDRKFTLESRTLFGDIHSLKSNAAYIGENTLAELCNDIEYALKSESKIDPKSLKAIQRRLSSLVQSLDNLFRHDKTRPDVATDDVNSAMRQLLKMIESNDFGVESHLEKFLSNQAFKHWHDDIFKVHEYIEEIEFERAAAFIREKLVQLKGGDL